jgi:hypothetical protein
MSKVIHLWRSQMQKAAMQLGQKVNGNGQYTTKKNYKLGGLVKDTQQQISAILGLPVSNTSKKEQREEKEEEREVISQEITDLESDMGQATQKESRLLQQVSVPLVKELADSKEFQASLFRDPVLNKQLSLQNVIPLEMKDGQLILVNSEETASPTQIESRYKQALEESKRESKENTKQEKNARSYFSRFYSVVKRGIRSIGSFVKSTFSLLADALIFLKHKIVTLFTFLYNNIHVISWIIRTLITMKRAICTQISSSFRIRIYRPSKVTWFYKLKQWWSNWVVPISYVAWPGIKGMFFSLAPQFLAQLTEFSSYVTNLFPPPDDSKTNSSSGIGLASVGLAALETAAMSVGLPAGTATSIVGWIQTVAPFVMSAGPLILRALETLDTLGNLQELLMDTCLRLQVEMTDDLSLATHYMILACHDSSSDSSPDSSSSNSLIKENDEKDNACESRSQKVIRFVPQPSFLSLVVSPSTTLPSSSPGPVNSGFLFQKLYPYLFPNSGIIDVSIEELMKVMQLPSEFLDTEAESLQLLQKEYDQRQKLNYILSDAAYESYFTLLKMLELYEANGDSDLPINIQQTYALLQAIDEQMTTGKLNWQFRQEWNEQFTQLTRRVKQNENKDGRSSSVSKKNQKEEQKIMKADAMAVQKFFGLVSIAFQKETSTHGADSPKSQYLSSLYEILQTIMMSSKIEIIPKQTIDAAQEAIARYQEGHKTGSFCLIQDENLLLVMRPFISVNPLISTLYDQLQKLMLQNQGWFSWCVNGSEDNYVVTADVGLYVEANKVLQEYSSLSVATKKEWRIDLIPEVMKRINPYRNWNMYDRLYNELSTLLSLQASNSSKSGGVSASLKKAQKKWRLWSSSKENHLGFAHTFPFL